MANEVRGMARRKGDRRHCIDLSNTNACLFTEGDLSSPSLTIYFTDKELIIFYRQLKEYIEHKRFG